MSDPLSPEETKDLVRLCETGRLYEVEAWIRSGRSLTVPKEIRRTPLIAAIDTGFHSLVELLLRHESRQEAKDAALEHALMYDRLAIAELVLGYGADVNAVPFLDVLMTGDRSLAASFLAKGADPITGHPFAHAFHELRVKSTLGSYLDCRRSRPELGSRLHEQADMALRQFAQDGNLKWVSLLVWVGANPRSQGPALDDAAQADEPEFQTTALEEACWCGHFAVLKRLKPNRDDNLDILLERAALSANRDVLAHLLDLGADPNNGPDGTSKVLEVCIRQLGRMAFYSARPHYSGADTAREKLQTARGAVGLLLQRGAVWKPDLGTLPATRRVLYYLEPKEAFELVRQLAASEGGDVAARELVRVPRMRCHLATCQDELERLGLVKTRPRGRRRTDARNTRGARR